MNPQPLVGIITRTKNRTLFLRRAMESVLHQTYLNWAMVIVNDGGNPADVENMVQQYANQYAGRIRVVHNAESLGMNGASKKGFDSVEADLLIVHDDDDSWAPEFLSTAVSELTTVQHRFPNTQGVTTYSQRVVETVQDGAIRTLSSKPFNAWIPKGLLSFDQVLTANPIPPISFLFTANAFRDLGSVYEVVPILGDWEFLVRFMSRFDVFVIPQVLACYHHRDTTTPGPHSNSVIAQVEEHALWRQYLMNTWLREDLASGKFGVGTYANLRTHIETLMSQSGLSAHDADATAAQGVVNYYWDSFSWRVMNPLRSVAAAIFRLPPVDRPKASNMKEAWRIARDIQESVSWNATAPLRFIGVFVRALRKG